MGGTRFFPLTVRCSIPSEEFTSTTLTATNSCSRKPRRYLLPSKITGDSRGLQNEEKIGAKTGRAARGLPSTSFDPRAPHLMLRQAYCVLLCVVARDFRKQRIGSETRSTLTHSDQCEVGARELQHMECLKWRDLGARFLLLTVRCSIPSEEFTSTTLTGVAILLPENQGATCCLSR